MGNNSFNDDGEDVEDEEDFEEEDVDEDELDVSDTETVGTTDTSETTETVDSLFENVRFPKEENKVVDEKTPKPKIDLGELVKQDLRKIVPSIEYYDEEKFEGGKKIKSFHKKQKEMEAASSSDHSSENPKSTKKDGVSSDEKSTETLNSNKRKSGSKTSTESTEKKVKTSSGTFSVSEESS